MSTFEATCVDRPARDTVAVADSAAADRSDDVHAGAGLERCFKRAALPVDVDVDVRPQRLRRFAETVS